MLLTGVLVVFAFRGSTRLTSNADQTARYFIEDVKESKLDKAYASTSTLWRNNSSFAEFKKFVAAWRKQQGDFKSVSLANSSWFASTTGSRVTLFYDVQGSRQNGRVTMIVVSEGKGLAVQACNFSPQISNGTPK